MKFASDTISPSENMSKGKVLTNKAGENLGEVRGHP